MFPQSSRLDHHAHIVALREGADALYRRTEVGHIQALAQAVRQLRFEIFHHQRLALLADINTSAGIGKVNHDASFASLASAKVNLLQSMFLVVAAFSKTRQQSGCGLTGTSDCSQRHQQILAFKARLMTNRPA